MGTTALRLESVSDDTPLRLDVAARLAFPDGSIGVSSLRNEARKGRLVVWRIANKDMTTLGEIKRMQDRCRVKEPPLDSGSDRPSPADKPHGLSRTESARSAQSAKAALLKRVEQQKQSFKTTSQTSTTPSPRAGHVVPLKSR